MARRVASIVGLTAQRRGRHPCLQDCTGRLVARLDQAAEAGEVVKMHELAILTTLEVICQVGRKVVKWAFWASESVGGVG